MPTVCFVSFEFHPVNPGGCGVFVHHAAEALLLGGHEIVLLVDMPAKEFVRLDAEVRPTLPHAARCRAYQVDALCADFPFDPADVAGLFLWKSLRFAHALRALRRLEHLDAVEFFEYCGPAYHALVERLYDADAGPTISVRLHGAMALIDRSAGTPEAGRERYVMYGLERGALRLAEAVLTPSLGFAREYFRDPAVLDPAKLLESPPPYAPLPSLPTIDATDRRSIACFGRLALCKGVDQLVEAGLVLLERHPELPYRFDIVGADSNEGPGGSRFSAYLRSLVPEALADRFTLHGHLSQDDAVTVLARARFAVFPNRFESFCYSLHEVYEAGIPVVVNDIPAFAAFFTHEENALVYDGSVAGLVAAMERMLTDDALVARLRRPYPIRSTASEPVRVAFHALAPVRAAGPTPAALVVVLQPAATDAARVDATRDALGSQAGPDFATVHLVEATTDAREVLWWLGRAWRPIGTGGTPLHLADLVTSDTIALLLAGDRPAPSWLATAASALAVRRTMGFSGTWASLDGHPMALTLDVALEAWPFEHGAVLTRTLVRTRRGQALVDLLDPTLGTLGEIGLLWDAVARYGPGHLFPRPLVEIVPPAVAPAASPELAHLVQRYGGPFADRLAYYLATRLAQPGGAEGVSPWLAAWMGGPVDRSWVADHLDGRSLLRIAARKLARKLASVLRAGRRPTSSPR